MDKVFIKNLQVYGILGIHPHEQRAPQKIRVSIEVTTDISEAAAHDDVTRSVDYSVLSQDVIQFIDKSSFLTIEALIEALAAKILDYELVQSVWIRIEKPDAVPQADSVGVEITRAKPG